MSVAPLDMQARYTLELRDRDPATVEDLILDNCRSDGIAGLDDKLTNLQSLSIINVGLKSLAALPALPSLNKLDVSDNEIVEGLDVLSKNCPNLLHLNLSNNHISDLNVLAPFKDSMLAELDFFSNPVGTSDEYRHKVFELIPSLQILDGCDVNGEEVEDDISSEGEGSNGEDASDDEGSDEDGPGLSYLDNSQLDEDETEDYDPEEKKAKKRAAGDNEDEPSAKKSDE